MNEASVNIMIAVIGALGSVLTVVAVFFTRKGLAYLESKTQFPSIFMATWSLRKGSSGPP